VKSTESTKFGHFGVADRGRIGPAFGASVEITEPLLLSGWSTFDEAIVTIIGD
jgi:hypothetical protein